MENEKMNRRNFIGTGVKGLALLALGSNLTGCFDHDKPASEQDLKNWNVNVEHFGKGYVRSGKKDNTLFQEAYHAEGKPIPKVETIENTLTALNRDHDLLGRGDEVQRKIYGKRMNLNFEMLAAVDQYLAGHLQNHYNNMQVNSPGRKEVQQIQGEITLDRWLQEAPVGTQLELGEYVLHLNSRRGGKESNVHSASKTHVEVGLHVTQDGEQISTHRVLDLKENNYSLFGTKNTRQLISDKYISGK